VEVRELSIPHAWVFTPTQHRDDRGLFLETYRYEAVRDAVGYELQLRQANTSVSARGVVRGIHYALVPPSQAKYVTVASGAILDFVIDIRVGSATFGQWDSVVLDDVDRRAVYIAEGLGHAFVALTEGATVSYFVSEVYDGPRELGVSPLDPVLGLDFGEAPLVSPRDRDAPTLSEAAAAGVLPSWDDCVVLYAAQQT
jgi:dTDP-4-dehydrorhamnose 3,5-epimerase